MSSVLTLCNLALSRIGQDPNLTSVSVDGATVEETLCATLYPVARDKILSTYDFTFMRCRDKLSQVFTYPHPPYKFIYAYPADCAFLKVVYRGEYFTTSHPENFEVENTAEGNMVVLTDVPNAWAEYQKIADTVKRIPPLVENAIVWQLAGELASAMIKGATGLSIAQTMFKAAEQYAMEAAAKDGQQSRTSLEKRESEFEIARYL